MRVIGFKFEFTFFTRNPYCPPLYMYSIRSCSPYLAMTSTTAETSKADSTNGSSIKGSPSTSRGAFIVLEGVDRCGKTTQCEMLVQSLRESRAAEAIKFPGKA